MRLIDHFMPFMAYVQAIRSDSAGSPETLALALDQLITQAQNSAVTQGVDIQTFQQALFPALAWADEQIANGKLWNTEHAWQRHLLQRRYFKTTLAGREFFDRLLQLGPHDSAIREVYLTCLCMGFLGRYSMTPNAAELASLKIDQYQTLLQHDRSFAESDSQLLFPDAYLTSTSQTPSGTHANTPHRSIGRWLLFILPPVLLLILALLLHTELTDSVQQFREKFKL